MLLMGNSTISMVIFNRAVFNIGLVVSTHLEKYESQWEGLSHILLEMKNVPNHQPVISY
jgi:hypothetical protein